MNWQRAITRCHNEGIPFAVVTVISTTGSSPRGSNAKMVVTPAETHDTIGGGQLELKVTAFARELLGLRAPTQRLEHFPLATKAQQCCGGSVTVLIETFPVTAMRLAVFGAGHVASALMQILAQCDARLEWIDAREDQFPDSVSANVQLVCIPDPVSYVEQLTDQHRAIILTHDHALDYRILTALLRDTDIDYVGLIGSEIKAERFKTNLRKAGFSEEDIDRCHCPIGMPSVKGKLPMEIGVSIAAELLSLDPQATSEIKPDLSWKDIKHAFEFK